MKRLVMVAALATAAVAACSDDDVAATATPTPDTQNPTPNTPQGNPPGPVPTFNLASSGGAPVGDASPPPPEVQTTPVVVPAEPTKRRIWAVDDRRHLLRILADDPTNVIDVALIDMPEGAKTEWFVGIDFRPGGNPTGVLYGLSTGSRIYTIDLGLARANAVGNVTSPVISGQAYGFDFNPVADKIRIHSDVDQNLRADPTSGAIVGTDAMLNFATGDVNYLQSPNLVGTAYTNSVSPTPATTALYAIDSTRNLLVKVDPPNDGLIVTVGSLNVDVTAVVGFDIWGSEPNLEAYAALRVDGEDSTGLYKIALASGIATLVGKVGHPRPLLGIAVQP